MAIITALLAPRPERASLEVSGGCSRARFHWADDSSAPRGFMFHFMNSSKGFDLGVNFLGFVVDMMLSSSLFFYSVMPPEEGDAESMYLSLTTSSQYSSKTPSFKFHKEVSLLLHGVKLEASPPPTALPDHVGSESFLQVAPYDFAQQPLAHARQTQRRISRLRKWRRE